MKTMTKQRAVIYHLQAELESIKHEMGEAMQKAYIPYVKEGRTTLHMEAALRRFYDWARRASEAGL